MASFVASDRRTLALLTVAQLGGALATSLNSDQPWNSAGRGDDEPVHAAGDDDATENHAAEPIEEKASALRCFVEAASAAGNAVGNHALRHDTELRALRMLPREILESLLLRSLDAWQAAAVSNNSSALQASGANDANTGSSQLASSAAASVHTRCMGPVVGPLFTRLVSSVAAESNTGGRPSQRDGGGTLNPFDVVSEFLNPTYNVRRQHSGVSRVPPREIRRGDIILLSDGDTVPADALLLGLPPVAATVPVSATRITAPLLTGSHVSLPRTVRFGDCPRFGATNVLPQGSVLRVPKGVAATVVALVPPTEGALALLLLNRSRSSSSSCVNASSMEGVEAQASHLPVALRSAFDHALFVPNVAGVTLRHRRGLPMLARCGVIVVARETALIDDGSLLVTAVIHDDVVYSGRCVVADPRGHAGETSCDALWSFYQAGRTMTTTTTSRLPGDVSQTQTSVNGSTLLPYHFNALPLEGEHASRITATSTIAHLRRLLILAAVAARAPSGDANNSTNAGAAAGTANQRWSGSRAAAALRAWTSTVPALVTQARSFRALVSDVAEITVPGHASSGVLYGCLVEYDRRAVNEAADASSASSIAADGTPLVAADVLAIALVVWGRAAALLPLCSFVSLRKGQAAMDSRRGVCSQVADVQRQLGSDTETFGVAIADVVPSLIGSSALPAVQDIATCIAQTQSLCFLGSIVMQPRLLVDNLRGLVRLGLRAAAGSDAAQAVPIAVVSTTLHDPLSAQSFAARCAAALLEPSAGETDPHALLEPLRCTAESGRIACSTASYIAALAKGGAACGIDAVSGVTTADMAAKLRARNALSIVYGGSMLCNSAAQAELVDLLSENGSVGVAFVTGAQPASLPALRLAHVGVVLSADSPAGRDAAAATVASNTAHLVVDTGASLLELAAVVDECRAAERHAAA